MIRAFADLGLSTGRVLVVRGLAGRRSDAGRLERKVAAIGVRVATGVTMHGFAITSTRTWPRTSGSCPCGIADAGVTSLAAELDETRVSLHTVAHVLPPAPGGSAGLRCRTRSHPT